MRNREKEEETVSKGLWKETGKEKAVKTGRKGQ